MMQVCPHIVHGLDEKCCELMSRCDIMYVAHTWRA